MTTPMAQPMAYPIARPDGPTPMAYGCYGTERYGTERKSYQDPIENPSVPDPRNPVDNRFPSLDSEWEAEYLGCEQAGLSATQIAERFGVTERTVVRWRAQTGRRKQTASPRRPASIRAAAERLLDDGCSFAEVARTVGVDRTTLHRWFPGRQAWTPIQAGQFAAMVRLGGMAA